MRKHVRRTKRRTGKLTRRRISQRKRSQRKRVSQRKRSQRKRSQRKRSQRKRLHGGMDINLVKGPENQYMINMEEIPKKHIDEYYIPQWLRLTTTDEINKEVEEFIKGIHKNAKEMDPNITVDEIYITIMNSIAKTHKNRIEELLEEQKKAEAEKAAMAMDRSMAKTDAWLSGIAEVPEPVTAPEPEQEPPAQHMTMTEEVLKEIDALRSELRAVQETKIKKKKLIEEKAKEAKEAKEADAQRIAKTDAWWREMDSVAKAAQQAKKDKHTRHRRKKKSWSKMRQQANLLSKKTPKEKNWFKMRQAANRLTKAKKSITPEESIESESPPTNLMDIYPEFEGQLERKYVWDTDIMNEDFTPEKLNYENCRRLQDYCELFPRKCYLNKDFLERLVKPCQGVKKTQLLINKFMKGYQFILELHDDEGDMEIEVEEKVTDMYNNKYPGIVPTDQLSTVVKGQSLESPRKNERRMQKWQSASSGMEGDNPNYVLENTLDLYIERIDIPDDIKVLFKNIIQTAQLDEEPLYGDRASITDFIVNLRLIEKEAQLRMSAWQTLADLRDLPRPEFEYNNFPEFIEFVKDQFKKLEHYSDLEVQQFVDTILERLTDLIV